tara:strand:- start:25212 stop:25523 length:312 start_codon:yes stop_codon:yes gene_type:complete
MLILLVLGCSQKEKFQENDTLIDYQADIEYEINQLKIKVSQLEELIQSKYSENKFKPIVNNPNQIKSITIRIGSEDDRIRIYWKDGSKTDLPCTKEQKIWACG